MVKINELNSCKQNRNAESILVDTKIKTEIKYCVNNSKSFENMVKSKVSLETVTNKD